MTTGKNIALIRWTFVAKVMSLFFNMLPRFVIVLLPRSKHLLISWLQSPSIVILELKKRKCHCLCFATVKKTLDLFYSHQYGVAVSKMAPQ